MDAIERYIGGNDTAMIVMGTHGASGVKMDLLGSNTYEVAKEASVPMLVIPLNGTDVKPEKVIFFTDYREADQYTLLSLVNLFGHLIRKCTLVHIHEESAPPTAGDEQKLTTWKEQLQGAVPHVRLDSELVHGKESIALVDDILDRYNASLTVLTVVGGRGFFPRLMASRICFELPIMLSKEYRCPIRCSNCCTRLASSTFS